MSRGIGLVVSDVDGTLVDREKRLTPATIAAVGRLRAAGIAFTIVSARPRSGMMPIADTLEIDLPMGAVNGGTVFCRDGTLLRNERIDARVVREMLDLAAGLELERWLFADDRWYADSEQGPHTSSERVTANQSPVVIDDLAPLLDRVDKLTFVSDTPGVLAGLAMAADHLTASATIAQSQTYYLDVTASRGNKGDGISTLAQAIGVPLEETVAIGDQANDLAMFERAGTAIAMGQAPDAVRARADRVTETNDADGVAAAIDALLAERNASILS